MGGAMPGGLPGRGDARGTMGVIGARATKF